MFIMRYFFSLYIYIYIFFFNFFSICITIWFVIFIFLIHKHIKMLWLLPHKVWNVAIFCWNIGKISLLGQYRHDIPYLLSVRCCLTFQTYQRFHRFLKKFPNISGSQTPSPLPPLVNAPIFACGAFHFNFFAHSLARLEAQISIFLF